MGAGLKLHQDEDIFMPDKELVLTRLEISRRIEELGKIISRDYRHKELVAVGILKGAFVFLADLLREIKSPLQVDFLQAASYGAMSTSCGEITIMKDIELDVVKKDVLIVEDIVDTGHTLSCIKDYFAKQGPHSIRICTLIDKKERREANINIDYAGFEIMDGFLIGYGLDYAEQYRHYQDIYRLKL